MPIYKIFNGPMPTTACQLAVTTGTSIKTMLQLKPFNVVRLIEWGVSMDGAAAAAGVQWELLDTGTVFATVTASADADVYKFDGAEGAVASVAGLTLGTAATGYTGSAEGTITTTKIFDSKFVQPTNNDWLQWPLGREVKCIIGNAVRIRVKAAAAVNALCYILLEI
jgi:hypothetical protein